MPLTPLMFAAAVAADDKQKLPQTESHKLYEIKNNRKTYKIPDQQQQSNKPTNSMTNYKHGIIL